MIKKRLIILGAPGVGKGTQAKRLKKAFHWAHISTGDMLREEVRESTPLGRQAKSIMEKGELVPDDLILEMVGNRLNHGDCQHGFILDGFPRTVNQAEKLEYLLRQRDLQLDGVITIEVPTDEIIQRLLERLVCETCGYVVMPGNGLQDGDSCPHCSGTVIRRRDDNPITVRKRLDVYHQQTDSLIKYYEGKRLLKVVSGMGLVDDITKRIFETLELSS